MCNFVDAMLLHSVLLAVLAPLCWAAPQVQIGKTTLVGRDVTGLKQDFFGGIPFAEPPIGALRLKPPVLKTKLNVSTFDASNYGYSCLQPPSSSLPVAALSENCLFINVFRPSGLPKNASLPVLFWTYGGGFAGGTSSAFNASAIVAQSAVRGTPLIYVSFNYRLGPLGFPQGHEANQRKALNLALKDQLTALEWVHENIGFFGGDKKKVTVFGESAGAIMTAVLYLNSPIAKYARATILESGSAATSLTYKAERRENSWQDFVSGVSSCASTAKSGKTFDCLKKANTTEIFQGLINSFVQASEEFPFDPTIDGPDGLYPDYPSNLFARGHFAKLPFIAGTNLDEGTGFIPTYLNTEEQLEGWLVANFSPPIVKPSLLDNAIEKIFKLYPNDPAVGSPYGTGNETFGRSPIYKQASAIQGDIAFQSQRRAFQQVAARHGVKTFGYLFTEPNPAYVQQGLGVPHGSEVQFVYGAPPDTTTGKALSAIMIDYWISFATSLDPNDGKGFPRPHWNQYTSKNQTIIQLNGANTTMIPDDYRKKQMDYLNSIPRSADQLQTRLVRYFQLPNLNSHGRVAFPVHSPNVLLSEPRDSLESITGYKHEQDCGIHRTRFCIASAVLITGANLLAFANPLTLRSTTRLNTFVSRDQEDVKLRYVNDSGVCETTPGVHQMSGYIDIGTNMSMWFWFFEARNSPETAPFTLWLNGGPGCSSMVGLFQEHGPCLVNDDKKTTRLNPYSWNEISNMIYIDQPIGTGFSYGNDTVNSTDTAAPQVWQAFQILFESQEFSKYEQREFIFATESYGGHYGPNFVSYFEQQNAQIQAGTLKGEQISVSALMINNGWFDPLIQNKAYVDFTSYAPGYGQLQNDTVIKALNDSYSRAGGCRDLEQLCYNAGTGSSSDTICQVADDFCYCSVFVPSIGDRDVYDIRQNSSALFPPEYYVDFLNQVEIQQKIGAEAQYTECPDSVYELFYNTADDARTQLPKLSALADSKLKILIWAGDADLICNWLGVRDVVSAMDWYGKDQLANTPFTNMTINGQTVAAIQNVDQFTFARVYEAGHAVPAFQPATSLEIFRQIVAGEPLHSV